MSTSTTPTHRIPEHIRSRIDSYLAELQTTIEDELVSIYNEAAASIHPERRHSITTWETANSAQRTAAAAAKTIRAKTTHHITSGRL